MSSNKTKLELTWIGKEHRPRLESRILLEVPEHSHHAAHRVSEKDIFDNMLVRGDNLLGLKALEQIYARKVKCVFIDPPYNTGSAFEPNPLYPRPCGGADTEWMKKQIPAINNNSINDAGLIAAWSSVKLNSALALIGCQIGGFPPPEEPRPSGN